MLQRKLMTIIGVVTSLWIVLAVVAVWWLQGLFTDLQRLDRQSQAALTHATGLGLTAAAAEVELHGRPGDPEALRTTTARMTVHAEVLRGHPLLREPSARETTRRVEALVEAFSEELASLAATEQTPSRSHDVAHPLAAATKLHQAVIELVERIHTHARAEQAGLMQRFRWAVIGLALAFLLITDVSFLLLVRVAVLVLRPVESLVRGSRELARENFDHHVPVYQEDEFGELAQAYNALAERLVENEQRKMEMLNQTARTLNHELNNAMATIELQVAMAQRRADDHAALQRCLLEIHENLERMARVVEALKHVRRIVLTDYGDGQKMLDLDRSTSTDSPDRSLSR